MQRLFIGYVCVREAGVEKKKRSERKTCGLVAFFDIEIKGATNHAPEQEEELDHVQDQRNRH